MEGFKDGVPILAKVSWASTEVALLNGRYLEHGLLAETKVAGGITRWFVPYTSIQYVKQDIADETPAPEPAPVTTTQVKPAG